MAGRADAGGVVVACSIIVEDLCCGQRSGTGCRRSGRRVVYDHDVWVESAGDRFDVFAIFLKLELVFDLGFCFALELALDVCRHVARVVGDASASVMMERHQCGRRGGS